MVDDHVTEPAVAISNAGNDVALRMREEAFQRKRRPQQPPIRMRLVRFWTSPRVVVRDVLINDPRRLVLLSSATAATAIVATASTYDPTLIGLIEVCAALFAAATFGIFCVYLRSLITSNVCRWLGGDITNAETRAVLAWAWLPMALVALLLLPRTLAVIAVHMDALPGVFPTLHAWGESVAALYDELMVALVLLSVAAVIWAFALKTVLLADTAEIRKWRAFIASGASSVFPVCVLAAAIVALSNAR